MRIDTPIGSEVIFLGENGYAGEVDHAEKIGLMKGHRYVVKKIHVHGWSSAVELEYYPGEDFNTVMFSNV
jgi:hypothetical protein